MLSIKYEGNNKIIDLINTPNLIISGYEGLDQPVSETITISNPYIKGTQYQRSSIQDRQISFTFYVTSKVESVRYQLMDVFKSGEKGILTLKNEYREGKIDCYVEELIFDKFFNPTICTLFLRSPYPYFKGLEEITKELSNIVDMFVLETYIPEEGIVLGELSEEYKSEIVNESDINVGVVIEIIANGEIKNPVIHNVTTNKYIALNITLNEGDKLTITTSVGNKKVFVENDGKITNIINRVRMGSTFFQLTKGNNVIKSEAEQGGLDMLVYVTYGEEYGAI